MPTSVTGPLNKSLPSGRSGGFSLVELLVVLVIVAIMVGISVANLRPENPERRVEEVARQLFALLEITQQEALLTGRELALGFAPDEYAFFELREKQWLPIEEDTLFRTRKIPDDILVDIHTDGIPALGDEDDTEGARPDIYLLSNGESLPFEIQVWAENSDLQLRVTGSATGRLEYIDPRDEP